MYHKMTQVTTKSLRQTVKQAIQHVLAIFLSHTHPPTLSPTDACMLAHTHTKTYMSISATEDEYT